MVKKIEHVNMDMLKDLDQVCGLVTNPKLMAGRKTETVTFRPLDIETAIFIGKWKDAVEALEKCKALYKEHGF